MEKIHARAFGSKNIKTDLPPIVSKAEEEKESLKAAVSTTQNESQKGPIVVDVRTAEEFETGAYPGAINIPLDELPYRYEVLGDNSSREITVYCAAGVRSQYAYRVLRQIGYTNVIDGGSLSAMMAVRKAKPGAGLCK